MTRARAVFYLLIVRIIFVWIPEFSLAAPIRTLPNLTSIDFYEATSGSHVWNFLPNSLEMINLLLNPIGPNKNYDFIGTRLEFYEASTLMLLGAGLVACSSATGKGSTSHNLRT